MRALKLRDQLSSSNRTQPQLKTSAWTSGDCEPIGESQQPRTPCRAKAHLRGDLATPDFRPDHIGERSPAWSNGWMPQMPFLCKKTWLDGWIANDFHMTSQNLQVNPGFIPGLFTDRAVCSFKVITTCCSLDHLNPPVRPPQPSPLGPRTPWWPASPWDCHA